MNNLYRSKTLWLQEGDTKSKFFYARMLMRKHKNSVQAIHTAKGQYMYDKDIIVQESLNHYTNLYNGLNATSFTQIEPRMKINDTGK